MRPLKLFNKLISSERGFSLTEVLVGGGILAGVALAGARMFNDQKMAQKKVADEQKLNLYHQNIVKQMNLASNCNATFKLAGRYNQPFTAGFALTNGLKGCIGATCMDTNKNPDGTINLKQDANTVDVGTTNALLTIGPGNYVDSSQIWYAESAIVNTARTTTGPVAIRVTYRMNPRIGTKSVVKDVVVNARFSGGVFKECLSGQESNINNLQNDFCKSLNFDELASTGANHGKLAVWNEETQTCEIGTQKRCDTPGMVVDGLDSTGTIRCRPIVQSNEAAGLQQTGSGATCSNPQLIFDGATKTLKAVCP